MKFLKNYLYFINEGFDLGYFYKKEHMPELIQKRSRYPNFGLAP